MDSTPDADNDLLDLLAGSEAVGVARFDPRSGTVERPTPTFTRLTGIPAGGALADAVAAPQRAVLAAVVASADDQWRRVVLSFGGDGTTMPADRALSLRAATGAWWLAVERDEVRDDHVNERLVAVNQELADAHRRITAQNDALETRTVELAALIEELRSSRLVVRKLEGLLPVCAWCHRVRDDDDSRWLDLEAYLQQHQAVSLTHSICPACAADVRRDEGL
jgi:hypothetical protein